MESHGAGSSDQGGDLANFYFEPEPWTEAVCCMEGMECWTGSFANAAGRGVLEKELAEFRGLMEEYKVKYDELNQENLREAAELRAQ